MRGDVMKESAQAALSYVRSNARSLSIDPQAFMGKAAHVHVPAWAIPKDGPSAGVTMTTALASAASGPSRPTGRRHERRDHAPRPGASRRRDPREGPRRPSAGLRRVILPRHNEADLEDVPSDLRRELEFDLVDTADEVLSLALEPARRALAAGA